MSQATPIDENSTTELDDVLLYILARQVAEHEPDGYKIPISKVHDVILEISDDLGDEFRIPMKFHSSNDHVHSNQVKGALDELVPYTIPVRNPSFSLEISEEVAEMATEDLHEELNEEEREALDSIISRDGFQELMRAHSEAL